MDKYLERFSRVSRFPSGGEETDTWLKMEDVPGFLFSNAECQHLIVYGASRHAFLHAVLIPAELANPPDVEDLLKWECNAYSSWGVSVQYSEPISIFLSPPLGGAGSKTIERGEQLVFERAFEGRSREPRYYDFSQRFVHLLGAHFLDERNAYCVLNTLGDVTDVIRIIETPKEDELGAVIVFDRDALDEYLLLTKTVVALTFDFPRYDPDNFGGWKNYSNFRLVRDGDLFYRLHEEKDATCIRGCQVIRPRMTKDWLLKRYGRQRNGEPYESFFIHDWKHGIVCETSCAPGATSNYFTKSELPFELSPAFFRAEVLSKYKADSEKYVLGERSVSCRGGWYLKGLDINEAGQVHAYLVDLRVLPFEEQQYWRSYNEKPRGQISDRAFKADFEGCWCEEYNALESMKRRVRDLEAKKVPWWLPRPEDLIKKVNYPCTTSTDEWSNDLMLLDQFLIEGLSKSWLRRKVTELKGAVDPQFGSVRLLDECLATLRFPADDISEITGPLKTLHDLRTKLRGHAGGNHTVRDIKRHVLTQYKTYRDHYRALCDACDRSLCRIEDALSVWVSNE